MDQVVAQALTLFAKIAGTRRREAVAASGAGTSLSAVS